MYKIIKHGNTHKATKCTKCECIFEFTGKDTFRVHFGKYTIECPECEAEIVFEEGNKCKWYAEFEGVCCNGDCSNCADICPYEESDQDKCKYCESEGER